MKNLRTAFLCVSITLCSVCVTAQNSSTPPVTEPNYNKPKLFTNLPDNIPVSENSFNGLLSLLPGRIVNFDLSTLHFEGTVVSTASKYDNKIQSVVISSSNYKGARFTLSKINNEDGTISYTGRIISLEHGDLYELQKQSGVFVLVKKSFYELINE